jgi:hypothetical protein
MKTLLKTTLGIVFLAFALTGCEDLTVTVDSDEIVLDFTIPADQDIDVDKLLKDETVQNELDELLAKNNLKRENLKSVVLKSAVVKTIEHGQNINFNAIHSIFIKVKAGQLDELEVARVINTFNNADSIQLSLGNNNIVGYLDFDTYHVKVYGRLKQAVVNPINAKVTIVLSVTVGSEKKENE